MTVALLGLFIWGCARGPVRGRYDALREAGTPTLSDDLPFLSFADALRGQIAQWKSLTTQKLVFGPRVVSREEYLFALESLLQWAMTAPVREDFFAKVKENFDFMETYGGETWGEVMVTSYYEPEIAASRTQTRQYSQPILRTPADLVSVALSEFDPKFAELGPLKGRVVPSKDDPKRSLLVPYFNRSEIDNSSLLSKRGLEIAWADPIDVFVMQIQGSGTLVFPDGTRQAVGFAEQNGHRYESIGKFLLSRIPKEQMSLQAIEAYLRTLPFPEIRKILFRNSSYVFFKEREGAAKTYFGTGAVPGRTIATDTRFFPKGSVAFLAFERPLSATPPAEGAPQTAWVSRFVVDDDTGGAIRGPGRVDLFWGVGEEAKSLAGLMKNRGRLHYLVPKAAFLGQRQTVP